VPETLVPGVLGVLGLLIGSFLNVVIARVPSGESIVSPPSHCPKCNHRIAWYENVPVLSWLLLRGKCSSCKAPISPRYVLVELLTGLLFVLCFLRFGVGWPLVGALLFVSFVVPLIFTDAEHWILPDQLTLPGIAFGVLVQIPLGADAVWTAVFGAVTGFLVLRAMEWFGWLAFRKEAMGGGDKFLLALVGAFLGWRPMLGIISMSAMQAAVWGIAMLLIFGRAGPAVPGDSEARQLPDVPSEQLAPEEPDLTFSPAIFSTGLSWMQRLLLIPYTVLLQDIPDPPQAPEGSSDQPEWVPGKTNLPFGPWIGLAGLQIMLLGPTLSALSQGTMFEPWVQTMIGP
jgi:leader peptidase (prepilin peptidase) / N-methyltransferase